MCARRAPRVLEPLWILTLHISCAAAGTGRVTSFTFSFSSLSLSLSCLSFSLYPLCLFFSEYLKPSVCHEHCSGIWTLLLISGKRCRKPGPLINRQTRRNLEAIQNQTWAYSESFFFGVCVCLEGGCVCV